MDSTENHLVQADSAHTMDSDELRTRLDTYNGWNSSTKSPQELATAGFVYTGITDKVECATCHIRLYNWQADEDPIQAHKKYAPDCDFMLKNFPQVKAPAKPKKILTVKYPQYSTYQSRLDSFKEWPLKCVAQKPEMMAKSGFFYFGSADRARCFHCGVTLRDWDTDDYPPCAHKQWSQHCPFVQTLDTADLTEQIEDWERQEKMRIDFENSKFFDCSSSRRGNEVVADSDVAVTSYCSEESPSCVTAPSNPALLVGGDLDVDGDTRGDNSNVINDYSPSFLAVADMGYEKEEIYKAIEVRRREGCSNPDAMSILKVLLDAEG